MPYILILLLGFAVNAEHNRLEAASYETFSECIAGSRTLPEAYQYCKDKHTDREPIFKMCLFDQNMSQVGSETEEYFIDLIDSCMDIQNEITPGTY